MTNSIHTLLKRQLKRAFGADNKVPDEWAEFVDMVNDAYRSFDDDRLMLERSLELSSDELLGTNSEMRGLLQALPDTLFRISQDGTILEHLGGQAQDLTLAAPTLIGKKLQEVPNKEAADVLKKALREFQDTNKTVTAEYALPDKRTVNYYEARFVPITRESNLVLIRNITNERIASNELKRSLALQTKILESTADGIIVLSLKGTILSYNQKFKDLWDISWNIEAHDYRRALRTIHQQVKNFRHFMNVVNYVHEEKHTELSDLIEFKTGIILERYTQPFRIDNKIVGRIWCYRDMSARINAQKRLRDFAARLEQSNRELQDFAYVASHDLEEPLRKVIAFADRLKTTSNDELSDRGKDYLNRMINASQRMQNLIRDLLSLSRITTRAQPYVKVSLKEVAEEVISDLEIRLEQTNGKVTLGNLPTVEADKLQMRRIFQNLVGNGLKFHRENVPPLIHITGRIFEKKQEEGPFATWLEIVFKDNGIGFENEHAEKIFTVFQRLHGRDEYDGTGIGLAICRRIAERHGGSIKADGNLGKGAIFTVYLPVEQQRDV